jgi:hypothetical protein
MYKRILTSLIVVVALAGFASVTAAAAREVRPPSEQPMILGKLGEIGAWAVPSNSTRGSKPSSLSQQAMIRTKLGEIGAWAVPSSSKPASSSQQAMIRTKLGEIGAWAVPSAHTTPVATASNGFDWDVAGIGAASAFGALLIGVGSLVTIRRHNRPIAH